MLRFIKNLFTIDRQPRRGLLALEWAMLVYMLLTFVLIFFTYTKLQHPAHCAGRGTVGIAGLVVSRHL